MKNKPYFYHAPQWVRRVRVILNTMNVAGTALAVLAWLRFDLKTAGMVYLCYPVCFFVMCLVFHRIIIFEAPKGAKQHWRDRQVKITWLAVCIIVLVAIADSTGINFRSEWALVLTIPVILVISGTLFFLVIRRPRPREIVVGVLCAALVYGFIGIPYLHWICRIQLPVHKTATVLETEADRGGSRSMTRYYLEVMLPEGTVEKLEVSSALFHDVKPSDTVKICQRINVKYRVSERI